MSLADGFRRLRVERAARAQAIAGLESGRVGRDSSGQAARTFHCNFSSVKLGGGTTTLAALDYALRQGENEGGVLDVESVAGGKQRVLEAAAKIEESARVRTGPTAERILVKQTFELPADSTRGQRAACARAFVDDWAGRGHEAVAAVHVHGEELPQPHLHVLATARPLNPDGTVNRESSLRPFASKASVRNERANVAALVNEHCAPEVRFHPGKLADTGIERAAKKRIPQGAFREARAEIRAAPEKAAAIEAEMYAASRTKRAPLHGERTAAWLKRAPVIEKAKAVGQWPPRSRLREQQILTRSWRRTCDLAEERAAEKEGEARAAKASVVTLTGEKRQAETRAEKAEGERDGLRGRVGEMEARQVEPLQPLQLTERQREMLVGVCARNRIEGDPVDDARVQLLAFAARHEERDKAAKERKRREAEAKLELEAARERAEKAEDEKQKAEGRVRELEAGTASGTEAAAVREAQPVPDAVPKPLDLPAAWTLPVDELIKAGDVVARKAAAKWGVADSSPTAMPLDGIDGVPVLTFTPVRGLFRKQPASWRYEDAGRYAGEAAIEIEQPDITDRNLDWPDWRAAGEALSRALVTDALEDGAETPRWLEEQFPDLDKKYGPKIRTRKYPGENPRTYVGEMSGGKPHGAGTTTWKSGDRYEGAFENGHRHGQGVYDYPNGNRYEGEWRDGLRHGQGIQTWSDGPRYEGAFENDARHGQGVYDFADGGRYEGGWRKGKQHGAGIVISPKGEITEGVWEDGKRVEAAAKKTLTRYLGPEL